MSNGRSHTESLASEDNPTKYCCSKMCVCVCVDEEIQTAQCAQAKSIECFSTSCLHTHGNLFLANGTYALVRRLLRLQRAVCLH